MEVGQIIAGSGGNAGAIDLRDGEGLEGWGRGEGCHYLLSQEVLQGCQKV